MFTPDSPWAGSNREVALLDLLGVELDSRQDLQSCSKAGPNPHCGPPGVA